MFKTKIAVFFFSLFSLLLLVGCNSETNKNDVKDHSRGELKVIYTAQPPVLDPYLSTAIVTTDIMGNVFETLLTVDSNQNVLPMLADYYELSDDGKTLTFHLREGVLFHDGKEMLADDVVASMNMWKEKSSLGKSQFSKANFQAKNDYTVVLSLPDPLSTSLSILSHMGTGYPAIMPKYIIENTSDEGIKEYVGTGPFKFHEWKQDQHIHLARFDEYQARTEPADGLSGKREALVDDLYFIFSSDSSTRVAGIRSGEYDVAQAVPLDNAEQLESDPHLENYPYPGASLLIHFNKRKGIFTDVRARQAIAAALDMDAILTASHTNQKYYSLNHNMMMKHQESQWYSEIGKEKYNQKNPEKAIEMLKEIGYSGEEVTILTDRDYEDHYNASIVVQAQLKEIGLNVNLEAYDWPTATERREDENAFDMFIIGNVPVPEPTSNVYLREEYPGWTDSEDLKDIIDEIRNQRSLDDAKEKYDKLQEWFYEYVPVIKIGDYSVVNSVRDTVENFQHHPRPRYWNISN